MGEDKEVPDRNIGEPPVRKYANYCTLRDDSYWTSRENSLQLIELSSVNKVCVGFLL